VTRCMSELAIDRLLAGELAAIDADVARSHAAGCTRCGALLDDALVAERDFRALPPLDLPASPARRYAIAAGAVAAAAAAVIAIVALPGRDDAGTRTKGQPILGCFVSHAGDVRRADLAERVRPGDAIALFSTATEPGWLAVTSVDGAGVRSVYVPPQPYAAGREQVVPLSIVLDGVLGPERITGIFCPGPFDVAAPPEGCTTDTFTLEKVGP
jgi:hypothetical protein